MRTSHYFSCVSNPEYRNHCKHLFSESLGALHPVGLIKKWEKECCGSSRGEQIYATCWAIVTVYWTLLIIRQHPHEEKEESRPTGTMASKTSAEPEEQSVLVVAAPRQKKKLKNSLHSEGWRGSMALRMGGKDRVRSYHPISNPWVISKRYK